MSFTASPQSNPQLHPAHFGNNQYPSVKFVGVEYKGHESAASLPHWQIISNEV